MSIEPVPVEESLLPRVDVGGVDSGVESPSTDPHGEKESRDVMEYWYSPSGCDIDAADPITVVDEEIPRSHVAMKQPERQLVGESTGAFDCQSAEGSKGRVESGGVLRRSELPDHQRDGFSIGVDDILIDRQPVKAPQPGTRSVEDSHDRVYGWA